jgi:hypothetical protein
MTDVLTEIRTHSGPYMSLKTEPSLKVAVHVQSTIQPPIRWVPEALSPWVKRQGPEAPSYAEVKNVGAIYTSTPPYAFMTEC